MLIILKNLNGNRRSLYVYLTEKGRSLAEQVGAKFEVIEERALSGFGNDEKEMLVAFLTRMNKNMRGVIDDE